MSPGIQHSRSPQSIHIGPSIADVPVARRVSAAPEKRTRAVGNNRPHGEVAVTAEREYDGCYSGTDDIADPRCQPHRPTSGARVGWQRRSRPRRPAIRV